MVAVIDDLDEVPDFDAHRHINFHNGLQICFNIIDNFSNELNDNNN